MKLAKQWKREIIEMLQQDEFNSSISHADLAIIISVELGLTILKELDESNPNGLWVINSGYIASHETISRAKSLIIANSRILLKEFVSRHNWEQNLERYHKLCEKYSDICMFEINDDFTCFSTVSQRISFKTEREEYFNDLITHSIEVLDIPLKIASPGNYSIQSAGKLVEVIVPDLDYEEMGKQFHLGKFSWEIAQRKVSEIVIPIEELHNIARYLDKIELEKDLTPQHWEIRFEKIKLGMGKLFDQEVTELNLSDVVHIVGVVGSGKSTLIQLLTVYLVKEKTLKIGIMVENVNHILEMIAYFEQIDIKATPIIGRNSRKRHKEKLDQFVRNRQMTGCDSNIFPVFENSGYKWLSDVCLLQSFQPESVDFSQDYEPCNRLRKPSQKGVQYCPFLPICPKYSAERSLKDSSVWIFTPESFVKSKSIPHIDKKARTFLELAYWELDLMLIDEVDLIQIRLDAAFAQDREITANIDKLVEIANKKNTISKRGNIHGSVKDWNNILHDVQKWLNLLVGFINENESATFVKTIKSEFLNPILYSLDLEEEILKKIYSLEPTDDNVPEIIKMLREYRDKKVFRDTQFISEIFDNRSILECSESPVKDLVLGLPEKITENKRDDFQSKLYGLILITELDHSLRQLSHYAYNPDVLSNYELDENLLSIFYAHSSGYSAIFPNSPLGRYFGYKWDEQKTGRGGDLKMMGYFSIGRCILYNFPHLYEPLFQSTGPSLVCFSASSWMPLSKNYHFNVFPKYLIEPTLEYQTAMSQSSCTFCPFEDIKISGIFDKTEKAHNLEKLTDEIFSKSNLNPENPQSFIEQVFNKLPEDRKKILAIVGSYEQASIVARRSERSRSPLSFIPLRSDSSMMPLMEDSPILEEVLYNSEIRQFAENNAIGLVAPFQPMERGHNILNPNNEAAIGALFFMIRPMSHPRDYYQGIYSLNQWGFQYMLDHLSDLKCVSSQGNLSLVEFGIEIRKKAFQKWGVMFKQHYGFSDLDPATKQMELADKFILLLQIIGRTTRGDVPTRVYFLDAAFMNTLTTSSERNINAIGAGFSYLSELKTLLQDFFTDDAQGALLKALYLPFHSFLNQV